MFGQLTVKVNILHIMKEADDTSLITTFFEPIGKHAKDTAVNVDIVISATDGLTDDGTNTTTCEAIETVVKKSFCPDSIVAQATQRRCM